MSVNTHYSGFSLDEKSFKTTADVARKAVPLTSLEADVYFVSYAQRRVQRCANTRVGWNPCLEIYIIHKKAVFAPTNGSLGNQILNTANQEKEPTNAPKDINHLRRESERDGSYKTSQAD